VLIKGSNASFTFDNDTIIREYGGTDFEVDGDTNATQTVSFAGDIINSSATNPGDTTGRSVHIHDIDGGTITFTAASSIDDDNEGMLVEDNSGGTVNFLGTNTFDMAGTNDAVTLTNNDVGGTNTSITFASLDITTMGASSDAFVATAGGTVSVTGTSNTITTTGGRALDIQNMTLGSVDFESINATGGVNPVRLIDNLTGTVTIGDTGNAVGDGGTISGTSDAGIHVTNTNVTLNGVTVQNAGDAAGENGVEIFHTSAATMNTNLNRLTVSNATADRDGVVIDGTGGTGTFNANIQNLDVDVTGNGLDVDDGVTLTAGGTNTIDSVDGVGLRLNDITIAAGGANFNSVNVTSGDTNAIVMQDVTGGQVQIGVVGGATNSGGTLTTTGNAIVLTDVQNVDLRHVRVANAGGDGIVVTHSSTGTTAMDVTIDDLNLDAATARGINLVADNDAFDFALRLTNSDIDNADVLMDVTGAGHFGLLVENTDVSTDVGVAGRAFDLQFHDGATSADVTIRSNTSGISEFRADDGEALFIDSFDATGKSIRLLVEDSTFTDTNGTELAADIRSRGTTTLQTTIQGNTFAAANAAHDMVVQSSGTAASQMRLNLGGGVTEPADKNNAVGEGTLFVSQAGTSVFSIFERDLTIGVGQNRNNDPVDDNGGTFQNLILPPTLPTVP
jgi:hypothetical protein